MRQSPPLLFQPEPLESRLAAWIESVVLHSWIKPVLDSKDYFVTAGGAVLRIDLHERTRPLTIKQLFAKRRRPRFVVIKPRGDNGRSRHPSAYGRLRVNLFFKKAPSRRTIPLHVLVCSTFHGDRPDWAQLVAHRNGLKHDNRAVNLRWSSREANELDEDFHQNHFGQIRPDDLTNDPAFLRAQAAVQDDEIERIETASSELPDSNPDPDYGF